MSTKRTRLSAAERREQLMQVGRTVFAEMGFDNAAIEEIARRAGVSKPIVYEHFGNKEGLHDAIVGKEMDALAARVSEAMTTGTARARFDGAVAAFLGYVAEEPEGFAVLTREIDPLMERVGAIFSRELTRAGTDRKLAPLYATAVLGMLTQVGRWCASAKAKPDAVVRHVAALGWTGLRQVQAQPRTKLKD